MHCTQSGLITYPCGAWRGALIVCALAMVVLAGCAATRPPALAIDTSHQALAHSSRVQYIVVHYTAAPLARSLASLTTNQVSAHYLTTDDPEPRILQLVDESYSAWHAGQSNWYGRTWLNANAIGIEIVNAGYLRRRGPTTLWPPPLLERAN